ncbi:histamine N-methyltransferase-like [Ptychodera flava]|uniref:histamine N-methyltransferase-like n=1 Tax=Ptychodera flava TaxID=63121 RepID=UPI00396A6543
MASSNVRESHKLVKLSSNPDHYKRALEVALADRIKKLQAYCPEMAKYCMDSMETPPHVFRFLSMGSGNGQVDVTLLGHLLDAYPKIEATIVEPSPSMNEAFKRLVGENPDSVGSVTFCWHQMTVEDFLKIHDGTKFHFIFMSGVISYLKDVEKVLIDSYGMLAEYGTIAIINVAKDSWFYHFLDAERFPGLGLDRVPSSDVIAVFESIPVKKTETQVIEGAMEITPIFDDSSTLGSTILDMLTHTCNFRETAHPTLVADVLRYASESKLITKEGDKICMKNHRDLIFVQ